MDACVFLFDRTGNMARPWAEAGFRCYCVDIQHPKGEVEKDGIVYVGADARHWRVPHGVRVIFTACFPPCTHVAVSGARWFKGKGLRLLAESIELFAVSAELCEWSGAPYLIENPVSVVSSHWRKPDHTFDPWESAGYLPDPEQENTTKKNLSLDWWRVRHAGKTSGSCATPQRRVAHAARRGSRQRAQPHTQRFRPCRLPRQPQSRTLLHRLISGNTPCY